MTKLLISGFSDDEESNSIVGKSHSSDGANTILLDGLATRAGLAADIDIF